jgi:hypothetical protein
MFSIEYFNIAVFCKIDELLKEITSEHLIRAKGFAPALSDSEVMTMEIVAEYLRQAANGDSHSVF